MITIKAYYIKEDDKPNIIKQLVNYIKVQDNYIIIQPIKKELGNNYLNKISKKIKTICTKKSVQHVVISKELQKRKEFLQYIYAYNINTFDGKWLVNYMAYEAIDFIMQKTHSKKEETEIFISVNNITNEVLENLKLFVKDYKRINIVTNRINEFKYLEKKIYDEYGMMLTVTNNKRKSLEKAKLILNFDYNYHFKNALYYIFLLITSILGLFLIYMYSIFMLVRRLKKQGRY